MVANSASYAWRQEKDNMKSQYHQCSVCGRMFGTKSGMRKHLRDVHEKVPHPCPKCGKNLSSSGSLSNHIKFSHPS